MATIPTIPVVRAPALPSVNLPPAPTIQSVSAANVPQLPSPNIGLPSISKDAAISTAKGAIPNSIGVPTSVPNASNLLKLPKIPPIPALGESGITSGGGPQFASKVVSKYLSMLTGI